MFENIGEIVLLFWRTLLALPQAWRQRDKVFDQFFEIGNASLLMVCVLSFFIGAVIALQTGPVLVERSLPNAVGGLVGIAIAKELAPVMMAILIAGRIGSAMAAEIGSMRVYQEIDALRTMNINPIHYLVLPRILAIAFALPMLVVFSVLVGWFGGATVADMNTAWKFRSAFFRQPARHRGNQGRGQWRLQKFLLRHHHRHRVVPSGLGDDWRPARHRALRHEGRGELHRADRDF